MEAADLKKNQPLVALITASGEIPVELDAFVGALRKIVGPGSTTSIELRLFKSFEPLAAFLSEGHIPHVLLVDHPDFTPPRAEARRLKTVFQELRRNDPNIGIFV